MHAPPRRRSLRPASRDGGSAAVELTLLTPLLIMLILLIVTAGRLVQARLEITTAAAEAARAASLARDPATATANAAATAGSALAGQHLTCTGLAITTDTSRFQPGGYVSVHVSCTTSLAGLTLLHLPGAETLAGQASAPVDTYRGIRP